MSEEFLTIRSSDLELILNKTVQEALEAIRHGDPINETPKSNNPIRPPPLVNPRKGQYGTPLLPKKPGALINLFSIDSRSNASTLDTAYSSLSTGKIKMKAIVHSDPKHSFRNTGIFLPESIFVTLMEFIFWGCCVCEVVYAVYRVGNSSSTIYVPPESHTAALLALSTVFGFCMILTRTRTAIMVSWNILDSNPREIWHEYRKFWLWVDLFSTTPWDLFAVSGSIEVFTWLVLVRCTKAIRVPILFQCANPLVPTRPIRRVMLIFSAVVWGTCLAALIWMLLNSSDYTSRGYSPWYVLLTGLYWAIQTSTSVGYGDVVPKEGDYRNRILNCFMMLVGVGGYSYFVGYFSARVMRMDIVKSAVTEKKDKLNAVMEYYDVPWEVQKQAFSLYPRLVEGASINYSEVVDGLPPFMQEQMAYYVRTKLVSCVPMFKNAEAEILQEVCMVLEEEMVAPRQYIIRKGDKGNEMYFLAHGVVEVLGTSPEGDDIQLAILRDGSWFGEIALLKETTRNASVRTVTACDVLILLKPHFKDILRKYPTSSFTRGIKAETNRRLVNSWFASRQQNDGIGSGNINVDAEKSSTSGGGAGGKPEDSDEDTTPKMKPLTKSKEKVSKKDEIQEMKGEEDDEEE